MKIIVALDNPWGFSKITEAYGKDVYPFDIATKEETIELLAKESEVDVLITRDQLEGTLDFKLYAKQLRLANPNCKIIYVVASLNDTYKEFLFANEIFSILEEKTLTMENIVHCMQEDKMVIYQNQEPQMLSVKEAAAAYEIPVAHQVLPKQFIAIYGTSGAGKSFVASQIAKHITKDYPISVALLDMDIQNPAIDIYNNIEEHPNGLSQLVDEVDKQKEINDLMDQYLMKDKTHKKLWYMTNNTSLFDCQNKLCGRYYEKIYQSIHMNYDYAIVDLPASPFLDVVPYTLTKATTIYFVVNPNYISIRQAVKYLDLLTKLWDIPSNRIHIVTNKIGKDSLAEVQIESLLYGYNQVLTIPYLEQMDGYINGAKENMEIDHDFRKIYVSLGIEQNHFTKKKLKKNRILSFIKERKQYDH